MRLKTLKTNKTKRIKNKSNLKRFFFNLILKSKFLWIFQAFVLVSVVTLVILISLLSDLNINLFYAQYQFLFVSLPFVFQLLLIGFCSFVIGTVTKSNNTDLIINILPIKKRSILLDRTFVVFLYSLTSIIPVLILTVFFYSRGLEENVIVSYSLWIMLFLFLNGIFLPLFVTCVIYVLKTTITALIFIFMFLLTTIGSLMSTFIAPLESSEKIEQNVFKVLNASPNLNVENFQNITINGISDLDYENNSYNKWTPGLTLLGVTLQLSSPESHLNEQKKEYLLQNPSYFSTLETKVVLETPEKEDFGQNLIVTKMNQKSIFEYSSIKNLLNRIQSLITSNSLLSENLEDNNNYWQLNNDLFRTTRNLTLSKFTEKDLNIFREIIGLNTNEFKEIYSYSFLLNDLSSLISEHLFSQDFNKDFVEFLNYLWFNPTFKYNVSQLNFLNLEPSFFFPSVFVFDDKSNALKEDIEYIKNVLFKANFDNNDQIINVQTLAWNNTYKNLTDWQNVLASGQQIKTKQDWDSFFYKDNVTINNLKSLLDKTSLAQNGDFLEMQFQNNVFNPLKIDKNISLDVQQHYSYFSIIYWSGLVLLILLTTLIVFQRVEKKDIL